MKTKNILSLTAAVLSGTSVFASIQVPVGNALLQDFSGATAPLFTEWSTNPLFGTVPAAGLLYGGGGTAITDNTTFNNQVALLASTDVNQPVISGSALGTNQQAKWRSDLQHLATQPTGLSFNAIMANMTNAAAVPLTGISLSWVGGIDLAPSVNVNATDDNGYLNGHRLYYSTTGLLNSFQPVTSPLNAQTQVGNYLFPAATTGTPSQTWTASITFPASVAPGAPFYLMWVDDNAATNNDGAYYIDNVQVTGVPEPTSVIALLAGLGVLASRRRRPSALPRN